MELDAMVGGVRVSCYMMIMFGGNDSRSGKHIHMPRLVLCAMQNVYEVLAVFLLHFNDTQHCLILYYLPQREVHTFAIAHDLT